MPHIDFITSYFKDYRQRDIPCYKPLLDICIDPNGDIRPCCSDEPSGHALRDGIRNVLKSERYRQVVKKALEKSCDGCSCHYNLSLDMNLQIRLKAFLLRLRPVTSSESINRRTEGC
jgi:MoaA/NifB/PqqE/SkfB family radical SAM enzyme